MRVLGVTCVVRAAIRCGFEADVAIDFLCISPEASDAISAPAARQLIKTKRLLFIRLFPSFLLLISQSAARESVRGFAATDTPRVRCEIATN